MQQQFQMVLDKSLIDNQIFYLIKIKSENFETIWKPAKALKNYEQLVREYENRKKTILVTKNTKQIIKEQNQEQYTPQKQKIVNNRSKQQLIYKFPIKLLKLPKLKGRLQFRQMMKQEAGSTEYHKFWKIRQHKKKNSKSDIKSYVSVSCVNCKAKIIYHQYKDSIWKLISYKNEHDHTVPRQIKSRNCQKTFKTLSQHSQPISHFTRNFAIKNTDQVKKKVYYNNNHNFNTINDYLKSFDYNIKYENSHENLLSQQYPDAFVAVSKKQKSIYKLFGECVTYQITYNCIKQSANKTGKKLSVGLFSGYDNNNRTLIFGFSISTVQTKTNFKHIFKWFFQLMGSNHTTAIITHQHANMITALQELKSENKFRYHHIYDKTPLLRYFKGSLKQQLLESERDILVNMLSAVMSEPDAIIGNEKLLELKNKMIEWNLKSYYETIKMIKNHIFLWDMPNTFVGLSLSCSESLSSLLKLHSQFEINFYELIEELTNISDCQIKNSSTLKDYVFYPLELIFKDPKILEIRNVFERLVFDTFMMNYNRSQCYKIMKVKQGQQTYKVINNFHYYQYQIKKSKCSCASYEKIGIPCQHLILMHKLENPERSYIELFNQRWLPRSKPEKMNYNE